ncbi:alpha/beta hydrolase [Reinekea blandensis]|nr:alpha/beta hydrolase-fold protein [Reinekea blandensis]
MVRAENLDKISLQSDILQQPMEILVYQPPEAEPSETFPVLYLFHGQSESPAMFKRLGLFRKAEQMILNNEIKPVIIVAVDIQNSFGVNTLESADVQIPNGPFIHYDGGFYEDYLVNEVVPFIESHYPAQTHAGGRYVGGISMGGFAALHLAFRHPELFSKVGGHSPALVTDESFDWLYPDHETWLNRNPLRLAQSEDLSALNVYLDIGLQDQWGFIPATKTLAESLKQNGIDCLLSLTEGGHTSTYWSRKIPDYLMFYVGREDI